MTPGARPHLGALHGPAWAGLVVSPGPGQGVAFRFAVRDAGGSVTDLDDLYWLAREVGPHGPDGRYARVAFDLSLPRGRGPETPLPDRSSEPPLLVLQWACVGDGTLAGHVRLEGEDELLLVPYLPWDLRGEWRALTGSGVRALRGVAGRQHVAVHLSRPGAVTPLEPGSALVFGPGELAFVTVMDEDGDEAHRAALELLAGGIEDGLRQAADALVASRPRVDGDQAGLAAAVTDTLHAMTLLQPETGRRYTPAGRRWVFPRAPERGGGQDHWTLFGWDSFFNALELGLDDPALAWETLHAGLATAYPAGHVPNWRGRFGGTPDRSQPPVGSFAALKLHLRHPAAGELARAYPALARWAAWWSAPVRGRPRRGGSRPGLFTWGSDVEQVDALAPPWERAAEPRQFAAWESGQDDLPTWDEADFDPDTGTLTLDPVDLNCYRVLDEECLARIATEIGRSDEARRHQGRADALRAAMNEHLWDEESGSYRDRLRQGPWAGCRSASHFLPLAAGVPDAGRAARLVALLEDPERFWGPWVIPTVSRDDPHYPQQQYWRGTVWPPVNYLVVQGLRRYGFDATAAEVAHRGAELFLREWRLTGLARENFDSRTGEGGGQRHQSWGPLLALAELEEFADVTPWDGLRLGGCAPVATSGLRRLPLLGRLWDVRKGPGGLAVRVDGRPLLEADAPVVLRQVVLDQGWLQAQVYAPRPATLSFGASGSEGPRQLRISGHERVSLELT